MQIRQQSDTKHVHAQVFDDTRFAATNPNRRMPKKNFAGVHCKEEVLGEITYNKMVCESQIQQNVAECHNCLVFFDGGFEVLLLRKEENGRGCFCNSCTDTTTCSPCSSSGPIVKFRRVRKLAFVEHCTESGRHIGYKVKCSCPHCSCFGTPCCHFYVLLQESMHGTWSHDQVIP